MGLKLEMVQWVKGFLWEHQDLTHIKPKWGKVLKTGKSKGLAGELQ